MKECRASVMFTDDKIKFIKFIKALSDMLNSSYLYNGCGEDMSYIKILNSNDVDIVSMLEEYLLVKYTIDIRLNEVRKCE